ncbi:MAG TPA: polyprenyl synthetase family protein [Polyangia bacterium]|jgi:geranylgeranyl pyrophosphate synthase
MATEASAAPRPLDGEGLGAGDKDWKAWATARRAEVEDLLASRLATPQAGEDPGRLVESMRYSLLAPGKRLRPILALAAAEAAGEFFDAPTRVAAASVELVHCYSLIHDDLPAMDDDDFRRGKPSNHKAFDEATAILAGDGLLTLAFDWLAESGERSGRPRAFGRAALALARGAGMVGMVRGQARDLGAPPPSSFAQLEQLHAEKTGALFQAAVEIGAHASGASAGDVAALARFGASFGIAFQHADDLDDADHPAHAERARGQMSVLIADANAALGRLRDPGRAGALRALATALLPPQKA